LHVYLKDASFAPGLAKGDSVFIYEYVTGPGIVRDSGVIERRKRGKGGVICHATVITDLEPRSPHESFERYTNGKQANWRWIARTGERAGGFVPRETVNRLMGYEPGYKLFGFNAGRGIVSLEQDEYDKLKSAFDATTLKPTAFADRTSTPAAPT
jgi:hypothetical protein